MTTVQDIRHTVHQLMPDVVNNLKQLVSIPSIALQGYPLEQVLKAASLTETLLKAVGFQQVRRLEGFSGAYPALYGEIKGPPGTPTVLLYAHYDVQPSGSLQGWDSPPFELVVRNGRLYGRGAADDKSGIVTHLGTIQAFQGKPPVGIKIIVEGDEEFGSSLTTYIEQYPDLFQADVMIICDHGNITVGQPTLTTSLRGSASLTVEVQTLADQVHNGVFGGPVPDALIALCQMIATFHDKDGNVQIAGLESGSWQGADIPEDVFRQAANVLPDVELIKKHSLSTQLWASYAINVIGLDAPTIAGASNSLIGTARARINLRVPPDKDAQQALDLLIQHLKAVTPWNARLTITDCDASDGFMTKTDGPAYTVAHQALKDAYTKDAHITGDGASIPLTNVLGKQFPEAEIIIWGAEDLAAGIHGPNESVDLAELERAILAQVLFLKMLVQQ